MKKLGPFPLSAVLLIAIPMTLGCGSSSNNAMRQLQSLALSPAVANPAAGADVQFTATGRFNMPPSPDKVTPSSWFESTQVGRNAGSGIAAVDQTGLTHCQATGTTWITAISPSGPDHMGTSTMVAGTAQINCP